MVREVNCRYLSILQNGYSRIQLFLDFSQVYISDLVYKSDFFLRKSSQGQSLRNIFLPSCDVTFDQFLQMLRLNSGERHKLYAARKTNRNLERQILQRKVCRMRLFQSPAPSCLPRGCCQSLPGAPKVRNTNMAGPWLAVNHRPNAFEHCCMLLYIGGEALLCIVLWMLKKTA